MPRPRSTIGRIMRLSAGAAVLLAIGRNALLHGTLTALGAVLVLLYALFAYAVVRAVAVFPLESPDDEIV